MKWTQTLVICAVNLVAAAAIIGVQIYTLQRYEQRLATVQGESEFARVIADVPSYSSELGSDLSAEPPVDFDFQFDIGAPPTLLKDDGVATAPRPFRIEPDVLPPASTAEPLPSTDELLRQIVTEELPNSTDAERAVWLEELAGLPPTVVRELLRVRRQFNENPVP